MLNVRRSACGRHCPSPPARQRKKLKSNPELVLRQQERERTENLSRWVRQSINDVGLDVTQITNQVTLEISLKGVPLDQQKAYLEALPGIVRVILMEPKYKNRSDRVNEGVEGLLQKMCS